MQILLRSHEDLLNRFNFKGLLDKSRCMENDIVKPDPTI